MESLLLLGAIDPNLVALIVFATIVLFLAVIVFVVTIEKDPNLLASFFKGIGNLVRELGRFLNSLLG